MTAAQVSKPLKNGECKGCGCLTPWCDECGDIIEVGVTVMCIEDGQQHLCPPCWKALIVDGGVVHD